MRAGAVREPQHLLPVLARRHASAVLRLQGLPGHLRGAEEGVSEELVLDVPGPGHLIREQLVRSHQRQPAGRRFLLRPQHVHRQRFLGPERCAVQD